ncbi:unnamed protein product [Phytophthora lilii]|uniref:Unnamed protein product n=1 Tax=Phytophthora lilii TaxID=2077276 RepID=A0A9W6WN55_9STRA|nr:unnamed protein product [Phytophthora lilii]
MADTYEHVSTHASLDEAVVALHSIDASDYVVAYNYGSVSVGKVYRCVSHENCPRRLRIVEVHDEDEEIPVTYHLQLSEDHGTQATNKRRAGITLALRGEVDALLVEGTDPKKCRAILQSRYERHPVMRAKIPNEKQLLNRRMTLLRRGDAFPLRRGRKRVRPSRSVATPSNVDAEESSSSTVEDFDDHRQEEVSVGKLDAEEEERFDKVKLMEEFAALPGRPVFWSILKKIRFIDEKSGSIVTEWITGQVVGWTTNNGSPTAWVVKFSDGEKRSLGREELADEIRAAAKMGLNVTGRPRDL